MSAFNEGSYSEAEAQEILRRAATLQGSGSMTKAELISAAAEVGISPQAIEEAEEQVRNERYEADLLAQFRALRNKQFWGSLRGLLVYMAFAAVILGPGLRHPWIAGFLVLCGVWGVAKEGWLAFNEKSDAWAHAFSEWRAKQLRRKAIPARSTDPLLAEILARHDPAAKLQVIKEYREQTGLGLKDAKQDVEDYYQRQGA